MSEAQPTVTVYLRCPIAVAQDMKDAAKAQGISLNQWSVDVLKKASKGGR